MYPGMFFFLARPFFPAQVPQCAEYVRWSACGAGIACLWAPALRRDDLPLLRGNSIQPQSTSSVGRSCTFGKQPPRQNRREVETQNTGKPGFTDSDAVFQTL